jgi:GTP-binding protein Era
MVSALKGDGTKQLVDYFIQNAPEGNFAYPEDQISDAPIKFFAAELTREKIFLRLQQEIPYAVTVETEKWEETDKSINIHQIIYVRKNGQKSIILGAQGQMIKNIGLASRKELERILEKKVNLFLFVKVRENWIDNPEIFNQMGFNTDQKS